MSKKPVEDDLLTGGKLGGESDNSAKKDAKISKKGGVTIPQKTAKIIKSAVCIVIVVALLVAYVATGTVRKGFIASFSLPAQTLTGVTVSNGEEKAKIKVATYNFYFASTYNSLVSQQEQYEQYGIDPADIGLDVDFDKKLSSQTYTDEETDEKMTWAEHLNDLVFDSIESTYTYYLEAVKANNGEEPEITESQQSEIDESLSSYKSTAEGYGYTLSGYLVRAMGKGVTENVFRTEMKRQYIAQNYQSNLSTEMAESDYTDNDVNKYKDEHTADLQAVDIMLFECDSEDDAKEFKDNLKADGSNFADLAAEYSSSDFAKENYKNADFVTELGVTRSVLQNKNFAIGAADTTDEEESDDEDAEETYSGLDWLFDSGRKAGESYQYSTSVVYILSPATIQDRNTVSVRHILIAPETDDENTSATNATDEQWNDAYNKARDILNEWKSGEATEDSFADLVADNTSDTGSQSTGGLYENVITGQMVNPFSVWCFDSSRKAGDTGIVKTELGYHIMYFVKTNDEKVWQYNARQALASDDSETLTEKLEEEYTLKVNWFGSRYFQKDVDIDN